MILRALTVSLGLAVTACGGAAHSTSTSQVAPPTPTSVTRERPGGDAKDPHQFALTRLLHEPFGQRRDRDEQLELSLPDSENWKRVRFWGVDHFVGFRYGKDYHALLAVFVQDVELEHPSSEECLRRFDAWGRPQVRAYDLKFDPFRAHHTQFHERPLIGIAADGSVNLGFSRKDFSAGWAAYAYYPHACMVMGVAVPWRDSPALARKVRDRFLKEAFALAQPLTEVRPVRKPR